MAFVFKVLKFASDLGNTSLRVGACYRPLQSLKIRTFATQNGVVCSNAAAEPKLEPWTNSPPGDVAFERKPLKRQWKDTSRRTGVIAVKLGMTQLWNKEGYPVAVTVLQVWPISLVSRTLSIGIRPFLREEEKGSGRYLTFELSPGRNVDLTNQN